MRSVAAIGKHVRVAGYALVGVEVMDAPRTPTRRGRGPTTAGDARLCDPDDAGCAQRCTTVSTSGRFLWAVMPE